MAWRVAVAVLAGLLAWPTEPAQAQGFLQLFGFGSAPPPRLYGYPGARPYPYPGLPAGRSLYVWPSPRPLDPLDRRDDGGLGRPGTYRTLCVRLCDGFYFPVSSATTGSGLSRDADACSASCGTEARLFYYPNAGGDVDSMVDLTGLAYSSLPNAFKYRKTLVPECRCRPQPWSEAELQRHRTYAAGVSAPTDLGRQTRWPGHETRNLPSDVPAAIERPDPVERDTAHEPWPSADTRRPARSRYNWPSGR
jgi:hypothetical protein